MQLEFGLETQQDDKMKQLGIGINLHHKVIICTVCHSAVIPSKLYDHIRKPRHHNKKDFRKNHRLDFATREFCRQLVKENPLSDNPLSCRPTSVVPALPGLLVQMKMSVCGGCNHAFQNSKVILRHCKKSCPGSKISIGPAQAFFPTSKSNYFGVELPPHSNPSPLDPAALFHRQFTSNPYKDVPIQAAAHPREMKLFLATENWLDVVDGMTGEEIMELVRNAQPALRAKVKDTVSCYISRVVAKLEATEPAVKVAVGDYNK